MSKDNSSQRNVCETRQYPRKFPLPPIDTSFPYERNPLDSRSEIKRWCDWIFESSSMTSEKFAKLEGTTLLTSYFHPFCNDITRYENLVKYNLLFFVFDDHTEADWGDMARNMYETRQIWGQFSSILDKLDGDRHVAINGFKPYVLAMYAVLDDIYDKYNDVQRKRSIETWREYIEGNLEETKFIADGIQFENIEQMIKIRRKSIGFRPVVQFLEYSEKIFIPEQDWSDPRLNLLIDQMAEIIIMVNDLFSFEKEFEQEHGELPKMFNLIALIAMLKHETIDKAMLQLAEMIRTWEIKIRNTEELILEDPMCSSTMRDFIRLLNYLLGGNHKFSSVSDRYNRLEWK